MTIIIIDGKRITYPILDPERSLVFAKRYIQATKKELS